MSSHFPQQAVPVRRNWGDRVRAIWAGAGGGRQRLVRLGLEGKVALALVLGMAGVAAAAVAQEAPRWPWPGSIVGWAGLLWSLTVAAASRLPCWGFAVAALWLAWQAVALMGPWAGTALVAFPAVWLLVVALSCWAWEPQGEPKAGLAGWGILSLGMGWLLGGPAGWNQLFGLGGPRGWVGHLLLSLVIAMAGYKLRPWWKSRSWTRPGWGRTLVGSAVVMGVGLTFSLLRDAGATEGWAWGEVEMASGWSALMWFWLGGAAGVMLVGGAEWLTRLTVRGITLGPARQGLPLIWLAVTVAEWLATHAASPHLVVKWFRQGVSGWPWWAREAIAAHAWVGVATVVLGAGFLYQGRDTVRMLLRLNAVWLGALGALVALGPVLAAEAGDPGLTGGRPGAAILLGLGMAWLVRQLWQDVPYGSSRGPAAAWSLLTAFAGLIAAHAIHEHADGTWRNGPAAVLGVVHLVLPVMLHRWWVRGRPGNSPVSLKALAGLTMAGMAGVLPVLQAGPASVALLGWEPVWWVGVLWVLRRQCPHLETADGALAGGILGVSAAAAWCRPDLLLPMVPMIPWLNVPAGVLAGDPRPFLEPLHFTLLGLLGATGAALGALIFRGGAAPGLTMMPLLIPDTPPPVRASGGA